MNNKKNYKNGTRRDVIYLLHGSGVLTKRAMSVLPNHLFNHRTLQRKIREMIEEGTLARYKPKIHETNASLVCMNNYEANKQEITVNIPDECIEFYTENHKEHLRKIWNETGSRPDRMLLESETVIFMYSVGADTMPDQLDGEVKYYGSREIKRYTGYTDDVKIVDGKKKVQFTKALGLLTSDGGNYAIYNVRHNSVGKLSGGEYKIRHQLELITKQLKGPESELKSGILLINKLEYLADCIIDDELNSVQVMRYHNFAAVYDSVYCIPYNTYGRDMVKLMTKPDWKEKLILSATKELQDTSRIHYVCDHYDKDTGIGTLVFCIPDIVRLKKFTDYAKMMDEKEKFRIICFDYQKELVKEVSMGKVQILTTPFYNYYEREGK